jgi:hypothetical protein
MERPDGAQVDVGVADDLHGFREQARAIEVLFDGEVP